jgi:adenylate cyclase
MEDINEIVEIENKYLVTGEYKLPSIITVQMTTIDQGYISLDPVVRLRKSRDKYELTIKGKGHVSKTEVEKELTRKEFDALWVLTEGKRLKKKRFFVPFGEYTIEFDVFQGHLEGLIMFEVEFKTIEEAANFDPNKIDWITSFEDVSEDVKYKNNNLAVNGY